MFDKLKYKIELFKMNHPTILSDYWKHLGGFLKRLYVFLYFYIMFGFVPYGLALLIPVALRDYMQISPDVVKVITKILFTLAPLIPSVLFSISKEEDQYNEISTDLCFVAWIITIVVAWILL